MDDKFEHSVPLRRILERSAQELSAAGSALKTLQDVLSKILVGHKLDLTSCDLTTIQDLDRSQQTIQQLAHLFSELSPALELTSIPRAKIEDAVHLRHLFDAIMTDKQSQPQEDQPEFFTSP